MRWYCVSVAGRSDSPCADDEDPPIGADPPALLSPTMSESCLVWQVWGAPNVEALLRYSCRLRVCAPLPFAMPAYWSVSGDPCPASGGCRPHARALLRLLFSPLLIICVTRRAARRASQSHLRSCGPTGRAAMWARRRGSTRSRHTPRPRSTTAPRGSPAR